MIDKTSNPKPSSLVQLGIHALPLLSSGMVNGGLYVLLAEIPSARFPILAGTLASALDGGIECNVILPSNPELFLQRINSFGELDTQESMTNNHLQLFTMQDEFSKKMFRFGAESFIQELEFFDVSVNTFLLFDQADELLSLHDLSMALDQVEVLSKWLSDRHVTALLVFTRVTEAHSNTINALMDNLTGIARLGGEKSGLEITFDFWQSPEGAVAARHFPLRALDTGLYEVAPLSLSSEQTQSSIDQTIEAADSDKELHVFYMDPDLGSLAKQSAGIWQQVDTLVGMMHATRSTRSATIILSFLPDTSLRQLAETAHTLRSSLGRHAHIVVQEKAASLRFQNEALLLRLGVNLVVHRDVPVSRLTLLLDSLHGQTFTRDIDINFEAALASVTPTRMRGYLRPLRFAREVNLILDRAETLNIPCTLILGQPTNGQSMVDVLRQIGLSRPGDLLTADNTHAYIFLNACQQAVMLSTLERLLGVPVDTVFTNLRFLVRREDIQPELAALMRALELGGLPDHSTTLVDANAEEASTEDTTPKPSVIASILNKIQTSTQPLVHNQTLTAQARTLDLVPPQVLMPVPERSVPRPAAIPREVMPDNPDSQFSYAGDASASVFGKQPAPRAVRSSQSKK
ncbi:MAG: hypothetical protein GW826_09250 [Rhodoferax sp.]|nr:hypothetical protein [Rhodoferax sp.]NCS60919.1 hypothetical protein [Rhodoferax sp.]